MLELIENYFYSAWKYYFSLQSTPGIYVEQLIYLHSTVVVVGSRHISEESEDSYLGEQVIL